MEELSSEVSSEADRSRMGSPKRMRDVSDGEELSQSKRYETDHESEFDTDWESEGEGMENTVRPRALVEELDKVESEDLNDDEMELSEEDGEFVPEMSEEVAELDKEDMLRKQQEDANEEVCIMKSALYEMSQKKFNAEEKLQDEREENEVLRETIKRLIEEKMEGKDPKNAVDKSSQTTSILDQTIVRDLSRRIEEVEEERKREADEQKKMREDVLDVNEEIVIKLNKLKLENSYLKENINSLEQAAAKGEEMYKKIEDSAKANVVAIETLTARNKELSSDKERLRSELPCANKDAKRCKEVNKCKKLHNVWMKVPKEAPGSVNVQDNETPPPLPPRMRNDGQENEDRRPICRFFLEGFCHNYDRCRFKHADVEIKRGRSASRGGRESSRGRTRSSRRDSRDRRDLSRHYRSSRSNRRSVSRRRRTPSPSPRNRRRSLSRGQRSDVPNWRSRENRYSEAELRAARDVRDPRSAGISGVRAQPQPPEQQDQDHQKKGGQGSASAQDQVQVQRETGAIPKRRAERISGNEDGSRVGVRPQSQAVQNQDSQRISSGASHAQGQGLRTGEKGGEGGVKETREGEGGTRARGTGGMARREESLIREGLLSAGRQGMEVSVSMEMIENSRERRRTRETHLQDVQERGTNPAVEKLMEEMIRVQRKVRDTKRRERRGL